MAKDHTSNFLDDAEVFKFAVESSDLGVWGYDVVSDELFWSRKLYEIMGVEPGSPVKYSYLTDLIHPDDLEWVQAKFKDSSEKKEAYDIEFRVLRADTGETIWGRFTRQAFYDVSGEPYKMFGTTVDTVSYTHLTLPTKA